MVPGHAKSSLKRKKKKKREEERKKENATSVSISLAHMFKYMDEASV